MKLFYRLYNKVLQWSSHRHAPYYLAGVSFIESSVFPIPPDVMLIPMVLSKPLKAWEYAAITTIASILGGLFGYALGYYAFELIGQPLINAFGYEEGYAVVSRWFEHYGFLAVFAAGVTPIPYKLFTLAAGASGMALAPFVIASIFGRALRFFIVAALVRKLGVKFEPLIRKYIDVIGWGTLIIITSLFISIYYIG
ncbi:MAG: YqaA family protein [Candidatus Berkiellales bacterium]